jgi:hypothetical protein
VLNRTFGCVRLVWNKALGERKHRFRTKGARTSYRETDVALTDWKRTEALAFLSEVATHGSSPAPDVRARTTRAPRSECAMAC